MLCVFVLYGPFPPPPFRGIIGLIAFKKCLRFAFSCVRLSSMNQNSSCPMCSFMFSILLFPEYGEVEIFPWCKLCETYALHISCKSK